MSDSTASSFQSEGFELAMHPNNGCFNFTTQGVLADFYADELGAWQARFPSVTSPQTNRFHCMVWSDWSSQPKVELANGIRLDTNYYYWPGAWMGTKPGFMTGSRIPMRFADTDGSLIDVYQAPTQFNNALGRTASTARSSPTCTRMRRTARTAIRCLPRPRTAASR